MADEERAVLLGTVQERQAVDDRAPTACKAGGTPVRISRTLSLCGGDNATLAEALTL